jgi:hypothetical protein
MVMALAGMFLSALRTELLAMRYCRAVIRVNGNEVLRGGIGDEQSQSAIPSVLKAADFAKSGVGYCPC